jgi:hypothetical protein
MKRNKILYIKKYDTGSVSLSSGPTAPAALKSRSSGPTAPAALISRSNGPTAPAVLINVQTIGATRRLFKNSRAVTASDCGNVSETKRKP